jgi:hypothetical protein
VDAKYHSGSNVTEIFRGMVAEHRFDVAELGLTYFLRTLKEGESPFVAIPVFPVRAFRHSAIFVNANSGINKPEDLYSDPNSICSMGRCSLSLRCEATPVERSAGKSARYVLWKPGVGNRPWPP